MHAPNVIRRIFLLLFRISVLNYATLNPLSFFF